jgi:hypothetical protein
MRRLMRLGLGAAAACVLLYAGDWLSLRLRIPRRDPYGSVQVHVFYVVALKDHKTDYMSEGPQQWTCVNSLFPHSGNPPCWYLKRNPEQYVDVNLGARHPFRF